MYARCDLATVDLGVGSADVRLAVKVPNGSTHPDHDCGDISLSEPRMPIFVEYDCRFGEPRDGDDLPRPPAEAGGQRAPEAKWHESPTDDHSGHSGGREYKGQKRNAGR